MTTRIVWHCDVCEDPIADGHGYIACDRGAAFRAARAHGEHAAVIAADRARAEGTGDDTFVRIDLAVVTVLRDRHPRVRWEVLHRRCDPHPERADYWFAVERARTLDEMLDWNAHLARKDWVVAHTNWFEWLQHALRDRALDGVR